jgi:hypothetical protein
MFDKHIENSLPLTLAQYCRDYICYDWDFSIARDAVEWREKAIDRTKKWMKTAIKSEMEKTDKESIRENFINLGRNPDSYIHLLSRLNEHFKTNENKPKILWDRLYYNGNRKLITSKQFARSFNSNNNYSKKDIEMFFHDYDCFVDGSFIQPSKKDDKSYFDKSMDFYFLESYKRIDFMYKLAARMENNGMTSIDREHPLVQRFHPQVLLIYMNNENNRIYHNGEPRHKYYQPLILLEESWQEEGLFNCPFFYSTWESRHTLRAKVYELFKYHYEFSLVDYADAANFIRDDYNILAYHEPDKKWIQEKEKKRDSEIRITNALEINKALFWP